MKSFATFVLLLVASFSQAQTITPNESNIVLQSPKKIGMNLNGPTYYQGGEIYKNLLWRNPGFEPDINRDKFVAFKAGTTTSFPSPNFYDPVPANFWTGATFRLYRGSNPRTDVCSGTISGNTTSSGGNGPVYKFASACSSAVQEGDVIILRQAVACTPEAVWENAGGGWWGTVNHGGKLLSECTAPYDGVQSIRMDASAAGSTAAMHGYLDSNSTDVGILINGNYTVSGFYKTVGSPTFSVSASRETTSAVGNPFSCKTQTFSPVSTWTAFTLNCTGSETPNVAYGMIQVSLSATGGVVLLDNVAFQKIDTDPTNTTVFRDELIATLKAHCAGGSLTGVPCELRDWAFQNADEISNSIKPLFERSPALPGATYDVPQFPGSGGVSVGLEEFLQLCQAINAEPYYALPETTGPEDAAGWIEYLNGSPNTPFGSIRAAHGQTASWLSVFPTIHLPMGNENWNEGNTGQGLGYRPDAPDFYYDYSVDAAGVWNQMRASTSWPAGGAGIDLVLGFQDGNANYGVNEAWARAQPNSGELAPYTQAYLGDVAPLTSLWNPLFYEVSHNTTNPSLIFFQQGSAIKAHGKLNVYEFDNATSSGGSGLKQSVLDSFTDAAGYGTATALQALQHLTFGIVDQNFFSLDQFANYVPNVGWVHNWGAIIDMGGATNAVRPQELGMRMANAAIIGPMYSCPVSSPTTYDLAANHNGSDSAGMPATKNVPLQYSYCFMSGAQRSMIVINTDVTTSHLVSFAGGQAPTGAVTLTRYAPSSISATNEGTADQATNSAKQNVAINAPITVNNPTSDTLPPYSITRYDWTSNGSSTPAPASTSIALSASSVAVSVGTPVTLTAQISPAAVTGSLVFQDDGVTVGTVAMSGGVAQFTLASPSLGIHVFTASYAGNTSYAASTSPTLAVTVSTPKTSNLNQSSIQLKLSTFCPAGGSDLKIGVTMNSASVTGTVTLLEGGASIASGTLTSGQFLFTVASIAPGSHSYVISYAGSKTYAASSANASVVASSLPSSVILTASSSTSSAGSSLVLTAAVTPNKAIGYMVFKDGSKTLGNMKISSGSAAFTISSVDAGTHSYTATYCGSSLYEVSTSAPVTVTVTNPTSASSTSTPPPAPTTTSNPTPVATPSPAPAVQSYIATTFSEFAQGSPLNGTSPAVNSVGAKWVDPNGDWTYQTGGGIKTDTPDLTHVVSINANYSNYTATVNLANASGMRLLFRYTDLNNSLYVITYANEVDLYSMIHGKSSTLATIYPSTTSGSLSVTLSGQSATLSLNGQSATATIPTTIAPSTTIGFQPNSPNFIIRSFEVDPSL